MNPVKEEKTIVDNTKCLKQDLSSSAEDECAFVIDLAGAEILDVENFLEIK